MKDHRKYNKKYREAKLAKGLCVQCGRNPHEQGRNYCTECREKNKLRRMKNAIKPNALCTRCKKEKADDGFAQCRTCRELACEMYAKTKARKKQEEQQTERKRKPLKDSLCWHCDNFACSWRQGFQPVEGWKAKATKKAEIFLKNGESREVQCYIVQDCPEFKRTGHYANDEEWESGLVSE